MSKNLNLRRLSVGTLGLSLALCAMAAHLAAQGTTGTVLGTVTDPSRAAIPDAKVQVTNVGTGAIQATMSDSQGRYRVPDLPVGDYEIQSEKVGFETVIRKGVTLNVGTDAVVDFSLRVGQVTQSVTVESEVSRVETTSAAISNLVDQSQMRDLPLNGRNFEQLVLLAPGVTMMQNISKSAYNGYSNSFSIAGTRASGQAELLDDTNMQGYQDRGSGSGILGTTLGVDAIAEFQILTNTYGAQYGGSGSVINAVTKSGTNNFHGSVFEFLRNSALDASNFFANAAGQSKPPLRQNQFGGTLGGPIKKDKMFFFVNYEGIRNSIGQTQVLTVPDVNAHKGLLPVACGGVGQPTCDPATGLAKIGVSPAIAPYLALFPTNLPMREILTKAGANTGTANITEIGQKPGSENYVVARYDWTLSTSDSIFARYLIDGANLVSPFDGGFGPVGGNVGWPSIDNSRNQFSTIEEKHIWSNSLISSTRFAFSRTFLNTFSRSATPIMQFSGGNILSSEGYPPMDGSLSIGSGVSALGAGQVNPIRVAQNRFNVGEDVFWTKGAHNLRMGAGLTRIQTNGLHPFPGTGTWTFGGLQSFLQDNPSGLSFNGPCIFSNSEPACTQPLTVNGVTTQIPIPTPTAHHDLRETDFTMYVQDDWKLRPTLTLNVGLRYAPTTNPWDATNSFQQLIPLPFGFNAPLTAQATATVSTPTTLTPVHNVLQRNPSFKNF